MLALTVATGTTLDGCADWSGITPHTPTLAANDLDAGRTLRDAGAHATTRAAADANAQWPTREWWRAYRDPQLDQLVRAAIDGSPTQTIAAARLREALAIAGEAHAATLPTLDASANLSREHWPESGYYEGSFAGENNFNNTATLRFDYPLDLYGAKRHGAERAIDTAQALAADARAAQLSLESNVVRAYIQFSLQYALRDVAQRTLADQQRVRDFAQRRFQAGIGTQLEISQAQTPLPQSELALEQIDEAIALSRNQLAALIGQGPGAGDALHPPALHFDAAGAIALPSTLPAELIGHRPDVVAMRWQIEAQARAVDVQQAAFYPNVDLVASAGAMAVSPVFTSFAHLSSVGSSFGPAISLPIFEGGRLRASLGAAAAGYDLAVGQYNDAVVRALHEIADQVLTFQSLERQQAAAARAIATAQRSFDLATMGFTRGLTDYLNVLSAEDGLLREEQTVKRLQASRFTAYADLMTALGGGLAQPGDAPRAQPPRIMLHDPHAATARDGAASTSETTGGTPDATASGRTTSDAAASSAAASGAAVSSAATPSLAPVQ
ncbi:MAG: efflux transporter outer membrane subunit [Janthinobacterium lividum]